MMCGHLCLATADSPRLTGDHWLIPPICVVVIVVAIVHKQLVSTANSIPHLLTPSTSGCLDRLGPKKLPYA